MRFWLIKASSTALPIIRAEGLAQHPTWSPDWTRELGRHQPRRIRSRREFILTGDHDYFDVLTSIHQQPDMAIGAPRLIDPDAADIVLEVSTALAGSTGTALIYAPDVQARSNLGTKRDRVKPAVLNSDGVRNFSGGGRQIFAL